MSVTLTRSLKIWLASAALAAAGELSAAPMAWVISSDDGDRFYQLDLANGSTGLRGTIAMPYEDVEGLALSSSGELYGVDDATKTVIRIDTGSAATSIVGGARGNTGLPAGIANALDPSITFVCDGRLLLSTVRGKLYQVDLGTGSASAIGGSGITMAENITDIAARGPNLYGLGLTDLYRINPSTGTSTRIGSYGNGVQFSEGGGLAFDTDGTLWAIADRSVTSAPSQIYRIDPATGVATAAGSTAIRGIESLAIAPTNCSPEAMGTASIPIPTQDLRGLGLMLLALTAAGLWTLRRR